MSRYDIIATSAFGIESIVADELKSLGYDNLKVSNGAVEFTGDETDIARCNLWLRCADRVLIKMAEFEAVDFDMLYDGTMSLNWGDFIPENGKMHVTGKAVRSTLQSLSANQSIVKKAVVESMKKKYRRDRFDESGPVYKIEISMLKDVASITVDTSGPGLHRRGYRTESGEAPLRETLAAAIVYISRWTKERLLSDPMCGSGTIAIEAAMMARNIAPGLKREFASEEWPQIPRKIWKDLHDEAMDSVDNTEFTIMASDIDRRVFDKARDNAMRAGVAENINYQKKPLAEFSSSKKYGCIITNPPYGERLGSVRESESLYRQMGDVFSKLDEWSIFVLSGSEDFEKFYGKKSTKNRKLYNGKIKTYLYQYFASLPGRNFRRSGSE